MRVGRSALDEEAIRLIEEHNPEVEFDWTRILKGQAAEARPAPPPGRERFDRSGRRSPEPRSPEPRPPVPHPPAEQPVPLPVIAGRQEEVAEMGATPVEPMDVEPYATGDVQPLAEVEPEDALRAPQVPDEAPPTPAHARLGSEGVLRLRARYAEVMARISERIQDPARQDELKTQAERLNPDTWVTDAEVGAGLEEYETVFEALRTAIGGPGRGRRHKRRHGAAQQEPEGRPPENAATEDL